jgi:integrase
MRAQVQRGTWTDVRDSDELVRDFAGRWLDSLTLAPGTVDSYRYGWGRLEPVLGDLRLDQLRRPLLERTLAELRRPDGKPLAPSTRASTHAVLAMLLKAAVDQGQLASSPLTGVRPPAVPRREVPVLDRNQLTQLLGRAEERWRPMLTVAVGTGLRQGELFGLRRHRVDYLRRTVAVEEQVTSGKSRPPALTPTLKTPASRRRLPVPDAVTQALSQVLEERPDADVFFLTPRTGSLWRRSHFNSTVWKPTLEAAGLPGDLGFHVLRHTYASHLIAAGLHPRVIQARMGHASIVETMDTYGHLFPDGDDATRQALDELLGRRRSTRRTNGRSRPSRAAVDELRDRQLDEKVPR